MESTAGFAISTYGEDLIKSAAEEHFGPRGDAADRREVLGAGLVDASGDVTRPGWEVLTRDVLTLERNSLAWLRKHFKSVRDDGHDSRDDLVGTVWFDPKDLKQASIIEIGVRERVDMSDSSYGDLSHDVWRGVSKFGESVLGGAINFYNINSDVMEVVERTVERSVGYRRTTSPARRRRARKR
jgi:hypothetical protein